MSDKLTWHDAFDKSPGGREALLEAHKIITGDIIKEMRDAFLDIALLASSLNDKNLRVIDEAEIRSAFEAIRHAASEAYGESP